MMARQDDRRIFSRDVRLNILSLQESLHLDIAKLWQQLNFHQQVQTGSMGDMFAENITLAQTDSAEYQLLMRTLKRFVDAKTLGSLIQVPQEEEAELKVFLDALYRLEQEGDFQQKSAAKAFIPFIQQAWILAQRYDAVVANPPYMGGKGMNGELKEFAKNNFPDSKADLFAMFMQHAFSLLKENGFNAQVNMQSWMFLSSYEALRGWLLNNKTFITMAHLGARAFGQISGEVVQTTVWVVNNNHTEFYRPVFFRLINGSEEEKKSALISRKNMFNHTLQNDFKKIPGAPIAYWISESFRNSFSVNNNVDSLFKPRKGIDTGDNEKFLRGWHEISHSKIGFNMASEEESISSGLTWFPYNKGGDFRKWYGNFYYVINWKNGGFEVKNHIDKNGKIKSNIRNKNFFFKSGITWTDISSSYFGVRYLPQGFICDNSGSACYGDEIHYPSFLAMLASKPTFSLLKILNPTLHFQAGNISSLPVWGISSPEIKLNANKAIDIAKEDWDSYETSWDFKRNKLISKGVLRDKYHQSINENNISFNKLKEIEEKNNEHFINSLHISTDELSPVVENDSITLKSNIFHRYGINTPYNEGLSRYRSETIAEMISYSLGCQMGRYSLDREGLVYAHEGNKGFADLVAEGAYKTFPADSDGILPLMDDEWFDDDVTSRVKEFVRTVWGEEHLQENLEFIAESLCLYAIKPKKGESALETIRRYLSTQFWKDHMKMYKKRPIYWLFSSGKEKAFECLVYLHRYNDATLSRMRTEYVVPLLARYQANIDRLNDQLDEASGGETTRLKRERDSLIKKFSELRSYDDRLRHYADMRISIDLDDGVKVNYGKFGDLLADVKAITGNSPEVI